MQGCDGAASSRNCYSQPLESSESTKVDLVESEFRRATARPGGLPPGRPPFRSTTPHSRVIRGSAYRPCANVPCVFASKCIANHTLPLDREPCRLLVGSPRDGSTRLMQSQSTWIAVMHLAHVGRFDLAPAASCGGPWKASCAFDSMDSHA
jgi:hypothetical protein